MKCLPSAAVAAVVCLLISPLSAQTLSGAADLPPDIHPQTRSRLPPATREGLSQEDLRIFDMVAGGPDRDAATLAGPASNSLHSPKVAEAMHLLITHFRTDGVLGTRLSEVAILVAAREFDQHYEWSGHEGAALRAGVPQSVVDAIKFDRDIPGEANSEEALIIRFARQLLREHRLDSNLWAQAVASFGHKGALELAALIGDYVMAGIILHAVDQQTRPERPSTLPPRN